MRFHFYVHLGIDLAFPGKHFSEAFFRKEIRLKNTPRAEIGRGRVLGAPVLDFIEVFRARQFTSEKCFFSKPNRSWHAEQKKNASHGKNEDDGCRSQEGNPASATLIFSF
jgi:hypothetical protein